MSETWREDHGPLFVKICGVTSEEDALIAVAMGANAVGFVFAPSPRQMSPAAVAAITRRLHPEVMTVGVFRDALPERVVEIVQSAGLRGAQLHGDESIEDCAAVAEHVGFVVKAFTAGSPRLGRAGEYRAHALLVDAPIPGSGRVFDWRLAEAAPQSRRLILAGGLTPHNVGAGIRRVRPWGVDVSSGVESAPGVKDPLKVKAFVQAARLAADGGRTPSDGAVRRGPGPPAPYDWQVD